MAANCAQVKLSLDTHGLTDHHDLWWRMLKLAEVSRERTGLGARGEQRLPDIYPGRHQRRVRQGRDLTTGSAIRGRHCAA